MSGDYRPVFARAADFAWKTLTYDDVTEPLIPNECMPAADAPAGGVRERTDGAHTAVVVEFTLPASAYATMALREILKIPTDVQFHVGLLSPCVVANSPPSPPEKPAGRRLTSSFHQDLARYSLFFTSFSRHITRYFKK